MTTSEKPLRIAIIGSGFMGETHGQAFGKGGLAAEVACIVSRRLERAQALAAKLGPSVAAATDIEQVLDDPAIDIVDICTPTPTHRELVERAAAAGKHVLCEKPIALSVEDADRMIEACERHGVVFMVAHVLRFWPEYVTAAELLAAGEIGPLRHLTCTRLSPAPAWAANDNWFADLSQSGGAVVDLAIHDFDVVGWFAGTPTGVHAVGNVCHFEALFQLAGKTTAHVAASTTMPVGWPFRMAFRIDGEAGSIEFDGSGGKLLVVSGGEAREVAVEGSRAFKQNVAAGETLDGYFYQVAYFLDCVRHGRQPERGTPLQARAALAVALQVQQALTP